jgi:hypothetical protein
MLAFTRRLALASLLVAGCSGDDRGDDGNHEMDDDPSHAGDGDGDGEGNGDGDGDGHVDDDNPADVCGNGEEAYVDGLALRDFAVYQVVKIDVIKDRVWQTDRNAPIVAGKKALVRAFVTVNEGWKPHAVNGVLTLENGAAKKYLVDDFTPQGDSVDTNAGSTLNFNVDAADITPETKFSIAITEKKCTTAVGAANQVRVPTKGTTALNAKNIGKLRVVVVPVTVNGITPPMSDTQLEEMRTSMLAMYPVPDVEVSWREPLDWPNDVQAFGNGWSDLLNEIANVRSQDRPDDDVYYYGVITPSESFYTFCQQGCVLGLSPQAVFVSPDQQVSLGVGFVNAETYTTMQHEVGHAHGRAHAPCGGAAGPDPGFPNTTADIDVWGWDSRDGSLKLPSTKDIMGYCSPTWISAYTYKALAVRSQEVNNTSFRFAPSNREWVSMVLYDDANSAMRGHVRWGNGYTRRMPGGESEQAIVKDSLGKTVGEIEVVRVRLSHSDDSFLYLPSPRANWASLVLGDREIQLRDVHAPL